MLDRGNVVPPHARTKHEFLEKKARVRKKKGTSQEKERHELGKPKSTSQEKRPRVRKTNRHESGKRARVRKKQNMSQEKLTSPAKGTTDNC